MLLYAKEDPSIIWKADESGQIILIKTETELTETVLQFCKATLTSNYFKPSPKVPAMMLRGLLGPLLFGRGPFSTPRLQKSSFHSSKASVCLLKKSSCPLQFQILANVSKWNEPKAISLYLLCHLDLAS